MITTTIFKKCEGRRRNVRRSRRMTANTSEGMTEFLKSPIQNHPRNNRFRKDYYWMLKQLVASLLGSHFMQSLYHPHILQRENLLYNIDRHPLNQVIQLRTTTNQLHKLTCCVCQESTHITQVVFLPKMFNLNLIMRT